MPEGKTGLSWNPGADFAFAAFALDAKQNLIFTDAQNIK